MRIIGRLDIKNSNLIKGINLEGLRVLGKPNDFALKYYDEGIDELIFIDSVASLYGRNNLYEINSISEKFGSQSLVLSVEAKKIKHGCWEVFTNNGREETGINVIDWVTNAEVRGIGEILLTSVDMEGTRKGFDYELLQKVTKVVQVPVIASGGFGSPDHMIKAFSDCSIDAIAIADALHFNRYKVEELKNIAKSNDLNNSK